MTPQTRNDLLVQIFDQITSNKLYYLGFKYDAMKQKGSCDCTNTGFLRFPVFTVRHKETQSVLYFKSHHGTTTRIVVKADSDFFFNALNGIKDKLAQYAGDWNDSATNPFHPDYNPGDGWNYDLGPKPPEEG